jgi:Family of unknown function (DUF6292)
MTQAAAARGAGTARQQWSQFDTVSVLSDAMAGYLRAVAVAVGVPPEGATFEISDTVTAYLALTRRWPARPGQDLMLVWSENDGWAVSVETDPGEAPVVVARWTGTDLIPEPGAVARFVGEAVARDTADPAPSLAVPVPDRAQLAERLARYARQ